MNDSKNQIVYFLCTTSRCGVEELLSNEPSLFKKIQPTHFPPTSSSVSDFESAVQVLYDTEIPWLNAYLTKLNENTEHQIKTNLQFIWVKNNDRFSQAILRYVSKAKKERSRLGIRMLSYESLSYDHRKILEYVRSFESKDSRWKQFFTEHRVQPELISSQDLIAHPKIALRKISHHNFTQEIKETYPFQQNDPRIQSLTAHWRSLYDEQCSQESIPKWRRPFHRVLESIQKLKRTLKNSHIFHYGYQENDLMKIIDAEPISHPHRHTGKKTPLDEHLENLRGTFSGKPELCFEIITLIIKLRRNIHADTNFKKFQFLLNRYRKVILAELNTRWLISICDTLMDFSKPPTKHLASLPVLLANLVRISETEYSLMNEPDHEFEQFKTRQDQSQVLWDGVQLLNLDSCDMMRNMISRLRNQLNDCRLCLEIFETVLQRIQSSNNFISRMSKYNPDFYKKTQST